MAVGWRPGGRGYILRNKFSNVLQYVPMAYFETGGNGPRLTPYAHAPALQAPPSPTHPHTNPLSTSRLTTYRPPRTTSHRRPLLTITLRVPLSATRAVVLIRAMRKGHVALGAHGAHVLVRAPPALWNPLIIPWIAYAVQSRGELSYKISQYSAHA